MLKAILFDLGNTLVDYGALGKPIWPIWREGLKRVYGLLQRRRMSGLPSLFTFTELALDVLEKYEEAEDHRVVTIEIRLRDMFAGLGQELDESLLSMVIEELMSPMLTKGELNGEAIPVLESLKERGFNQGLVSNLPWGAPAYMWRKELERLNIRHYFESVVFCADVGYRKPNPLIFEVCLEELDVSRYEALFVGDSQEVDILGAQGVGMKAVLRRTPWHPYDPAIKADWEIERLSELLQLVSDISIMSEDA